MDKQRKDKMTGPTYRDTTWRAELMGSEGWAVFAGPRMLASHLTEEQAHLIAAAPDLLEALQHCKTTIHFWLEAHPADRDERDNLSLQLAKQAIRKAEEIR